MTTALILVDIQNDYFPGGKLPLVGMEEVAASAEALLQACRDAGDPVFHIQHLSTRPGAGFFLPDTAGAEIHPCVTPLDDEEVVQKHFPNAFRGTNLLDLLQEADVKRVIICGAMSHMCVDATTRAAFDLGYPCTVVADACATRDLEFDGRTVAAADVHGAFMAALGSVYAKIRTTDELLDET